jgi:hypothetical protein
MSRAAIAPDQVSLREVGLSLGFELDYLNSLDAELLT